MGTTESSFVGTEEEEGYDAQQQEEEYEERLRRRQLQLQKRHYQQQKLQDSGGVGGDGGGGQHAGLSTPHQQQQKQKQEHPPSRHRPRARTSSSSSSLHSHASKTRLTPATPVRTPPTIKKNISTSNNDSLTLEGIITGLPKSGKSTLVRRLRGEDPFAPSSSSLGSADATEKMVEALIPYRPPDNITSPDNHHDGDKHEITTTAAAASRRVQLHVMEMSNDDNINDKHSTTTTTSALKQTLSKNNNVDFVVVIIDPRSGFRGLKYLKDILLNHIIVGVPSMARKEENKQNKKGEELEGGGGGADQPSSTTAAAAKTTTKNKEVDESVTGNTSLAPRTKPISVCVLLNFRDLVQPPPASSTTTKSSNKKTAEINTSLGSEKQKKSEDDESEKHGGSSRKNNHDNNVNDDDLSRVGNNNHGSTTTRKSFDQTAMVASDDGDDDDDDKKKNQDHRDVQDGSNTKKNDDKEVNTQNTIITMKQIQHVIDESLQTYRDRLLLSSSPSSSSPYTKDWLTIQSHYSSLKNCYGLSSLHQFIVIPYLKRQEYDLLKQLHHVRQVMNCVMNKNENSKNDHNNKKQIDQKEGTQEEEEEEARKYEAFLKLLKDTEERQHRLRHHHYQRERQSKEQPPSRGLVQGINSKREWEEGQSEKKENTMRETDARRGKNVDVRYYHHHQPSAQPSSRAEDMGESSTSQRRHVMFPKRENIQDVGIPNSAKKFVRQQQRGVNEEEDDKKEMLSHQSRRRISGNAEHNVARNKDKINSERLERLRQWQGYDEVDNTDSVAVAPRRNHVDVDEMTERRRTYRREVIDERQRGDGVPSTREESRRRNEERSDVGLGKNKGAYDNEVEVEEDGNQDGIYRGSHLSRTSATIAVGTATAPLPGNDNAYRGRSTKSIITQYSDPKALESFFAEDDEDDYDDGLAATNASKLASRGRRKGSNVVVLDSDGEDSDDEDDDFYYDEGGKRHEHVKEDSESSSSLSEDRDFTSIRKGMSASNSAKQPHFSSKQKQSGKTEKEISRQNTRPERVSSNVALAGDRHALGGSVPDSSSPHQLSSETEPRPVGSETDYEETAGNHASETENMTEDKRKKSIVLDNGKTSRYAKNFLPSEDTKTDRRAERSTLSTRTEINSNEETQKDENENLSQAGCKAGLKSNNLTDSPTPALSCREVAGNSKNIEVADNAVDDGNAPFEGKEDIQEDLDLEDITSEDLTDTVPRTNMGEESNNHEKANKIGVNSHPGNHVTESLAADVQSSGEGKTEGRFRSSADDDNVQSSGSGDEQVQRNGRQHPPFDDLSSDDDFIVDVKESAVPKIKTRRRGLPASTVMNDASRKGESITAVAGARHNVVSTSKQHDRKNESTQVSQEALAAIAAAKEEAERMMNVMVNNSVFPGGKAEKRTSRQRKHNEDDKKKKKKKKDKKKEQSASFSELEINDDGGKKKKRKKKERLAEEEST